MLPMLTLPIVRSFLIFLPDMAERQTRLLDQGISLRPEHQALPLLTQVTPEPGQILSSSPPFPRYMAYSEVATGPVRGSGPALPETDLMGVKTKEKSESSTLPMRPAPAKTLYPSRYPKNQGGNRAESGTADWISSEAGRFYLAKHQLQYPPTQLLSLECQKRKFNPAFEVEETNAQKFRCTVVVRDMTFTSGVFHNGVAAKQDAAFRALRAVSAWPLPPANPLYFVAQFSGQISDDAVHQKLRQVLNGRKYALSTQRYPGMSGGYLLLQIPDQGFPTSIIRLDRELTAGLESVTFMNVKKSDHCNLCANTALIPHARIHCPLWRVSPPNPVNNRQIEPAYGGNRNSFPQRLIKSEPRGGTPPRNHSTATVKHVNNHVDKQAELIRNIQDVMGTGAASSESQDPRVKVAFLEGIALGARLAATAPGNAANAERRRSRSPNGREPRGSDYWPASTYRARSPLATVRERQRSREPPMNRVAEPRQPDREFRCASRGRGWSPGRYGNGGQGASHWDNGTYLR